MNEKLLAEEIIKQISKIIKGNGALVGRDECMKIVWTDEEKRPSVRTFEKFKNQQIIPFVKIGKCVWYDPAAVLDAIKTNHTVRPRYKQNC